MRLTKEKLKQIIKEELESVVGERRNNFDPEYLKSADEYSLSGAERFAKDRTAELEAQKLDPNTVKILFRSALQKVLQGQGASGVFGMMAQEIQSRMSHASSGQVMAVIEKDIKDLSGKMNAMQKRALQKAKPELRNQLEKALDEF